MIHINGSFGEGGGQILRTSLALSLVTGRPFRIENIRANRKKPGLMRQHLTAVNAAAEIGQADLTGNILGSKELVFSPKTVEPGQYYFSVGTAGSATLVLQTILPVLLTADKQSELVLEGGTHNPFAPSFDFLKRAFLPIIKRMGVHVTVELERPGFYPAGGGKFSVFIESPNKLSRIDLLLRGKIQKYTATAMVANLRKSIGKREIKVVREKLGWDQRCLHVEEVTNSYGPGNVLTVVIESTDVTEVFSGFGKRGVPAEKVAGRTVKEIREYLDADVPVGRYLADQLIIPMALAGGGKFRTLSPTQHTITNIEVVKQFLEIDILMMQINDNVWEIELRE